MKHVSWIFTVTLLVLLACSAVGASDSLPVTSAAHAISQVSSDIIIPHASPKIRTYNDIHYALYFVHELWYLLGIILIIRMRLAVRVRARVAHRTNKLLPQTAAVYAIYSLATVLWNLPMALISLGVERSYGFATQTLTLWIADICRDYAIGLLYIPLVWIAYIAIGRSPKRWWLWLWAGIIPISIAVIVVVPVLFDTMYSSFKPLQNRALAAKITTLAERAGVRNADIYQVDISKRTTKLNAYVTGLGPSKRIVIWDTTLKTMPDDQILAIIGHELGHYVLRHIWWSLWIGVAGAFVILGILSRLLPWTVNRFGPHAGVNGMTDIAGLPFAFLLLAMIMFIQTPIESAISRYEEHQADNYGLQLTGMRESTARAFIAFVQYNYSDPNPPKAIIYWLYSHPPINERVENALGHKVE